MGTDRRHRAGAEIAGIFTLVSEREDNLTFGAGAQSGGIFTLVSEREDNLTFGAGAELIAGS